MVEAMYENSPEYFKKFQKRFKYTICDTEPKLQDSGIENYAYGYHSSSTVIDGCSFGSSHWHLIFKDTSLEDKNVFSTYASVPIPCLVTCFKFLILPTEKNSWYLLLVVLLFLAYMSLWSIYQSLIMFQPTKLKKNFLCPIL